MLTNRSNDLSISTTAKMIIKSTRECRLPLDKRPIGTVRQMTCSSRAIPHIAVECKVPKNISIVMTVCQTRVQASELLRQFSVSLVWQLLRLVCFVVQFRQGIFIRLRLSRT